MLDVVKTWIEIETLPLSPMILSVSPSLIVIVA
jgi:hypothetical protein